MTTRKTLRVSGDLAYRIAFVRHCADRVAAGEDRLLLVNAKLDLADALLAAVEAGTRDRLARLAEVKPRPVQAVIEVALRPKRRRA